jgi:hypothetical protein
MRQEIERALGRRGWGADDFWTLSQHPLVAERGWVPTFQDPYRRTTYAADLEALVDLSRRVGETIDAGLAAADLIIITVGLTECWRNRTNGMFVCLGPKFDNDETLERLQFHQSTYSENYDNAVAIVDQIHATYPSKQIVLSVSPVPLGRTWTGEDVVVANMTSKSILRAVVGQVCRERPHVVYWPSFEYAARRDVFAADGRHVVPKDVDEIISSFLAANSVEDGTAR